MRLFFCYLCITVTQCFQQLESFIVGISEKYFLQCNIMLTFNRINREEHFIEKIYSIQIELAEKHLHDVYLINFDKLNIKNEFNYDISWFQRSSLNLFFNVNRHRLNCILSVIFVEKSNSKTIVQLYKLLIPPTYEISKKDEDHYLIVTQSEDTSKDILFSKEFGMSVKHKIVLINEKNLNETKSGDPMATTHESESKNCVIKGLTVCFYCGLDSNEAGKIFKHNFHFNGNSIPTRASIFPDYAKNFNGKVLRASIAMRTQHIVLIKLIPGSSQKYQKIRGSYFYVIDALSEIFNFTYSVQPSSLGSTGVKLANGTWFGIVGDVFNENADIGFPLAITYERYSFVSFCYPFTWEWLTFATSIPKPTNSWKSIFWPFKFEIWLYLILTFEIFICIMFVTKKVLSMIDLKGRNNRNNELKNAEFLFGTFLEQDFILPDETTLRTITISWLLFGMIMGTAYKSKLVSALAFPIYNEQPETFYELANSKYDVGLCCAGDAAFTLFNSSSEPTYIKLIEKMKVYNDLTHCFLNTQNSDGSCIGYESMAAYAIAKDLSDKKRRPLMNVKTASTFFVAGTTAIPKRAIFRTNWNHYVALWTEMGLNIQWRRLDLEYVRKQRLDLEEEEYIPENLYLEAFSKDGPTKLGIENVKGVMILLILGLIISFAWLIIENIQNNAQRMKNFNN